MPLDPVEMTSAEQDPEPDSPDAVDHSYHSWVTADNHHFDHNLSDPRWISCVFSSEVKCITLIDLAVRYLPAKFSGPVRAHAARGADDRLRAEGAEHRYQRRHHPAAAAAGLRGRGGRGCPHIEIANTLVPRPARQAPRDGVPMERAHALVVVKFEFSYFHAGRHVDDVD